MPLDKILSGKTLSLLAVLKPGVPLSAYEVCLKSNLSRSTFYHIIGKFSRYGIINRKNGKYFLMHRYWLFHEFAEEFHNMQNSIKAREFSKDSVVLWSGVDEFILTTKEYRGKEVGYFCLTGVNRFGDFGIELIGTGQYHYYYSEKKRVLSLEDVIVHELVIDFSSRTILYSITLLLAHKDKINQKKLLKLGLKYDVDLKDLLEYLEGKEVKQYPYPSMEEVREVFEMYFGERKWAK